MNPEISVALLGNVRPDPVGLLRGLAELLRSANATGRTQIDELGGVPIDEQVSLFRLLSIVEGSLLHVATEIEGRPAVMELPPGVTRLPVRPRVVPDEGGAA